MRSLITIQQRSENFGPKLGQDLENRAAHPNQKFRGVPPPHPPGDDPSEDNKSRLCEVKDKLEQSYDEKIKDVIIRARARWPENGEKSSKYFLNLEKRNQVKKHMRKLQINSSLTTDPSVILSGKQNTSI